MQAPNSLSNNPEGENFTGHRILNVDKSATLKMSPPA